MQEKLSRWWPLLAVIVAVAIYQLAFRYRTVQEGALVRARYDRLTHTVCRTYKVSIAPSSSDAGYQWVAVPHTVCKPY
ncbi:MAG: hypothetical protein GIW99_00240 [Candidatus Eremiobacteraeota bacterium]|nr:hypothetical protein [Candidatus Eremiobacteraeota bacterium]MBC5826115.1 hypothetical protein [Candidatus Eremiobacteraeota bacterium]